MSFPGFKKKLNFNETFFFDLSEQMISQKQHKQVSVQRNPLIYRQHSLLFLHLFIQVSHSGDL